MPVINAPHLHLLMNHVPIVGTVIGLGLFLLAFVRRSDHLLHASLEAFFLIALASLPVYVTGLAAQEAIVGRPDVSAAAIAAHHDGERLGGVGFLGYQSLWDHHKRQEKGDPSHSLRHGAAA